MTKKTHEKTKIYFGFASVFFLFLLISFFVGKNLEALNLFAEKYYYFGLFFYFLILILETLFIPISAIPLIPIISNTYSISISFFVTLFGWVAGAIIAFAISRKFGKPFIKKIIPLEKIEEFENLIPAHKKFLGLILIRFFIPFDVVNYLIGLFTKINFKTFFFSTLIGTIPLSFVLVYIGTLSVGYQILSLILFAFFIIFAGIEFKRLNKLNKTKKIKKYKNGK